MTLMESPIPTFNDIDDSTDKNCLAEQFIMVHNSNSLHMCNNFGQNIFFNANEWRRCNNQMDYIAGGIQLLSEEFNANKPIVVYCANGTNSIINEIAANFGANYTFVPFNQAASIYFFTHVLDTLEANSADDACENNNLDSSADTIIAATDASMGRSPNTATIAGIAQDGKYFANPVGASNINQAELIAICCAVKNFMHNNQNMVIYSDSQWAIRKIFSDNYSGIPAKYYRDVDIIRRMIKSNRLQLHKVKGHSGHVMNDYADRLAIAQRRMRNVDAGNNMAIKNILQEFNDNLKKIVIE